jgi:DNA-directed RNA polymerase II subunit RPB2
MVHLNKYRASSTLNIYITAEKQSCVPEIEVVVQYVKQPIPLVVLFRALGVMTQKEMCACILNETCSEKLIYRTESILAHDMSETANMSVEEVLEWISVHADEKKRKGKKPKSEKKPESVDAKTARKKAQSIKGTLQSEVFPHCGVDFATPENARKTQAQKAFFLGYCVRKLLQVYIGELAPDDIDDYVNKRCCPIGMQLTLYIRQLMRGVVKKLHTQIFKATKKDAPVNLVDLINPRYVTSHLRYACATGNWGTQRSSNNQNGVCQVLNDTNIAARLSHGRQVNTPLNRDGKVAQPRQLHKSHLGIHCSAETPEGKAVGLLHQFTLLTRVRTGVSAKIVIDFLQAVMKVIPLRTGLTLVLVNGIVAGCVENPAEFVQTYKNYRQDHTLPIDSSIAWDKEISISTDAEACYRPLFRVSNLHKLRDLVRLYGSYLHLLWNQLLIHGVIDYYRESTFAHNNCRFLVLTSVYATGGCQATKNECVYFFCLRLCQCKFGRLFVACEK